jgi:hypothetical protein
MRKKIANDKKLIKEISPWPSELMLVLQVLKVTNGVGNTVHVVGWRGIS